MTVDFDQPCGYCRVGDHEACRGLPCGCIAPHRNDDPVMRSYRRFKRFQHPERESWTLGGWVL